MNASLLPNLTKLSSQQLDAAFQNAGYLDNDVRNAQFIGFINGTFQYTFQYRDEDGKMASCKAYVSVNSNGDIVAEF